MEYQEAKDTLDKYEREEILDEFKELEEAFIEAVEESDPDDIIDLIEDRLITSEAEARGISFEEREKYYKKLYKSWGGKKATLKKVKKKNLKIRLVEYQGVEYAVVTHVEGKPLLHASGSQDNFYMSVDYKKDEDGDWFFESFNLDLKVRVQQKEAGGSAVKKEEAEVKRADKGQLSAHKKDIYTLHYTSGNVNAKVYLNGFLMFHVNGPSKVGGLPSLNGWVMPGKNVLTIEGKSTEANATMRINIVASPTPRQGEGREVVSYEHPADASLNKNIEFEANLAPPSDFWGQAETITLDEATKEEALAFVKELHGAVESKDMDKVLNLMSYSMKESLKNNHQPEAFHKKQMEGFKRVFLQANVKPLPLGGFEYKLAANDKVVIVTVNGLSPLSMDRGGEIPIHLGKVNGKLIPVR